MRQVAGLWNSDARGSVLARLTFILVQPLEIIFRSAMADFFVAAVRNQCRPCCHCAGELLGTKFVGGAQINRNFSVTFNDLAQLVAKVRSDRVAALCLQEWNFRVRVVGKSLDNIMTRN